MGCCFDSLPSGETWLGDTLFAYSLAIESRCESSRNSPGDAWVWTL
jgi:hypothetical protein